MNRNDDKQTPARPNECADARCYRTRPSGITAKPRPAAGEDRAESDLGLTGVWLRRFAWARLRARTFYSVTGVFDGTDLP
jgi:hypothetical protein